MFTTEDEFNNHFAMDIHRVSRRVDNISGRKLYHYNECSMNDSFDLRQIRGVIFDSDGKLICRRMGYTPTYVIGKNSTNNVATILGINPSDNVNFTYATEGTMVTIYGGEYLSTSRSINAYQSHWGSTKSFGELFDECFPNWREKIAFSEKIVDGAKNYSYTYFITHPEIRYAKPYNVKSKMSITHIATFNGMIQIDGNTLGIAKATQINSTAEELQSILENCNMDESYHGVYVVFNGQTYKFITEEYNYMLEIRGNTPDLITRYLECRRDTEKLTKLIDNFPESLPTFANVEYQLDLITGMLYKAYRERYVKGNYYWIAEPANHIVRDMHGLYSDLNNEDVTNYLDKNVSIFEIYLPTYASKHTKTLWYMANTLGKESGIYSIDQTD